MAMGADGGAIDIISDVISKEGGDDDHCFYYHSWRNNVVIAFGTFSSFFTQFHIVSGVVCVVCPFAVMKN